MRDEQEILDHLEHYGVKGMRWGVRRRNRQKGISKSPEHQKREAIERKVKTKGVQSLSNRELSDFNRRIDLERNFDRLTKNDPIVKKGHDKAKALLAAGVTINGLIAFANSPAGKHTKQFIEAGIRKAKHRTSAIR